MDDDESVRIEVLENKDGVITLMVLVRTIEDKIIVKSFHVRAGDTIIIQDSQLAQEREWPLPETA